jgi:TMEM175 potassium channel family protein
VSTGRIEMFSDGVFAIAITLLVLEIRPPEDTSRLAHELGELWPSYVAYVVSFLLIGLVWANHHTMFEHIERGDRILLFLNVLLLMDVAFLPFPTAVMANAFQDGSGEKVAVVFYGATLVVGGVFFNAVWQYARWEHRLLGTHISSDEARAIGRRFMLGPVLYGIGIALGALNATAGVAVYAFLILFYWLPGRRAPRARPGG